MRFGRRGLGTDPKQDRDDDTRTDQKRSFGGAKDTCEQHGRAAGAGEKVTEVVPGGKSIGRPPQEVLALIEQGTRRDQLWLWFTFRPFWKPVLARVVGNRFRLRQHRNFQNSFGPLLYGEVAPSEAGSSEIRARFRMHPFTVGFTVLWVAGALAFGVVGTVGAPADGTPRWVFPAVSLGFAAFAVLLVCLGWWLGRNEQRTIWTHLEQVTRPASQEQAGDQTDPR